MSRQRSFQAALGLLIISTLYFAISTLFAFVVSVGDLEPKLAKTIVASIESLIYTFSVLSFTYSGWIVATFSRRRLRILLAEVLSVFLILSSTVPLFALGYAALGVVSSGQFVPEQIDYLVFSGLVMVGSDHPFLSPGESAVHLYAVESLLGFFLIPLLIALVLSVSDRLPEQSIE